MISKNSLDISWLNEVSQKNRKADKILVEKVIRALLLLEGLAESNIPFVFKGGTALMLMLGSTKRLSIDIDIIMPEKMELEPAFEGIIRTKNFNRFELQERILQSDIEKAHYKFFYHPTHRTAQAEEYILLDILFEEPAYQKTWAIPIDSSFIQQEGKPAMVTVPSFDDILADKLTAFAPNTTGIPYLKNGQSRAMEIIKQLYDIGCLFNYAQNGEIIYKTFEAYAITELGYRNMEANPDDVLEDIFDTALTICTRGKSGKGDYTALTKGITQIRNFIFSEGYHTDRAIVCASKAAYLSRIIKSKIKTIETYHNPADLKDWVIEQPFDTKFNKLKKSNPEAFFYWYKIYKMTS